MKKTVLVLVIIALASVPALAGLSATMTRSATQTETIEADGMSGSPWFHNAQGAGDAYSEFAVSDFSFSQADFVFEVSNITDMSVTYTQANAWFAKAGATAVWLAAANSTFDDLAFDSSTYPGGVSTATGLSGLGSADLQIVGTGFFSPVGDGGQKDTIVFSLSDNAEAALIEAINNGTAFRLVLAAGDEATAATYAGVGNYDYDAPQVSISAVPEPATVALLGLGTGILSIRRKRY